jgi:prephenate dehydrogenase
MWIFTRCAEPKFEKIIIIGLGLIGGSIARACRVNKISDQILAYDLDQNQLQFALDNKIIDGIYNFDQKISGNNLVIIAAPLSSYEAIATKIADKINNEVLIIDIGSLKNFVVEKIVPIFADKNKDFRSNFIPCHPIAGSEKSGVANSDANLFLNKKLIITPTDFSDKKALKKISLFCQKIGSKIEIMDAREHDKIFALVSHLPQFLAFTNRENIISDVEIIKKHLRLQASNKRMWQDIFTLNKNNLDYYLKLFLENLKVFSKSSFEQKIVFLRKAEAVLNLGEEKFNQKEFIQKEWELILKRIIFTTSFVNIDDVEKFKIHAGTGFKDFTAILSYIKWIINNPEIIKNNQALLEQISGEIKSKIECYKH